MRQGHEVRVLHERQRDVVFANRDPRRGNGVANADRDVGVIAARVKEAARLDRSIAGFPRQ